MEINEKTVIAGNAGQGVRSDCLVMLNITESGGIQIELKSKVMVMYGESIKCLIKEMLDYFKIRNAQISLEDSGALPFVLMARIEAAIKLLIKSEESFVPRLLEENNYESQKERFRFSRLYLPGNSPSLMINAGIHHPNGIILDLEDSVAPAKKHEAKFLVRNALCSVDFYGAERMVRINQIPLGLEDLEFVIPYNVHVLLVPKCESAEQILLLEREIDKIKIKHNITKDIFLMPIIESALGIENAFQIATSSKNIVALAIGLEDYTADLGTKRSKDASESFYARTRIVNACKAAQIQAIDSVFSDVADTEGLIENVKVSKSLGFEGMGCIHPRQIRIIHEHFAPDADEIEKAKKICNAYYLATEKGLGVVSLGSKMIDAPVVKRAEKTITLAVQLQLISSDWRNEFLTIN